jgi:hypothetical protein
MCDARYSEAAALAGIFSLGRTQGPEGVWAAIRLF